MSKEIENPFLSIEGYNCFGCGPRNAAGLRMKFYYDEATEEVFSRLTPRAEHCGYPGVLHGGIQATMLDEVAYWAVHQATGKPALTVRMELDLKKAVTIPAEVEVRAKVEAVRKRIVKVQAKLLVDNELKAQAKVTYFLADPQVWSMVAGNGMAALAKKRVKRD